MGKYGNKAQLCYVDIDLFITQIKTEDFQKGIKDYVKETFNHIKLSN